MLASAIQLAAGIIFAVAVFVRKTRKDEDIHAQTLTILNTVGRVNPRAIQLLYETYMFRFGTIILCVGYLMPIAGIEYEWCNNSIINTLAAIGISGIIVVSTHSFSNWLKDKRIEKLKGFKSPEIEQPVINEKALDNILSFVVNLKDGQKLAGKCSSKYFASYMTNQQQGFYIEEPYNISNGQWVPVPGLERVWIPSSQILKIDFVKH